MARVKGLWTGCATSAVASATARPQVPQLAANSTEDTGADAPVRKA